MEMILVPILWPGSRHGLLLLIEKGEGIARTKMSLSTVLDRYYLSLE